MEKSKEKELHEEKHLSWRGEIGSIHSQKRNIKRPSFFCSILFPFSVFFLLYVSFLFLFLFCSSCYSSSSSSFFSSFFFPLLLPSSSWIFTRVCLMASSPATTEQRFIGAIIKRTYDISAFQNPNTYIHIHWILSVIHTKLLWPPHHFQIKSKYSNHFILLQAWRSVKQGRQNF